MDAHETGQQLIEDGHSVLLIERGGKIPAYRFKDSPPLTKNQLWKRFRNGMNLAIRLPGLVALDADDDRARDRLHTFAESPITQVTPRLGEHRVYRLPENVTLGCRQRLFGCGFDLKSGSNAYLMFSPSYSQEHRRHYRLIGEIVSPIELPEFDITRIQEEAKHCTNLLVSRPSEAVPAMERVYRYVDRAEPARSGFNGHGKFFGVCCRTLRVFRWLTFDQFVQAMTYYSDRCQPPWSAREIMHKCESSWAKERTR